MVWPITDTQTTRQENSMVKKLKTLAKDEDKQLASAVRTSAYQIWQAGLGAFAKAQEEGGRVFNRLVQEGTELQQRTRSKADDRVADLSDTVAKVADGVSKQASGSWDKLEQVFEDRVARALATIGVPTHKDLEALTRQVEQLGQMVSKLSAPSSGPAPNGAAKRPAKTAVRKPAVKAAPKSVTPPPAKAVVKKAVSRKVGAKKPGALPVTDT
jgi:poly(hydroxyalkanoate) granule-associated protein